MTTTIESLPDELLVEITRNLCDPSEDYYIKDFHEETGVRSYHVSSLRLVSRRFSYITTPFLYEYFEASRFRSIRRIKQFLRLLNQQPDVARYTERVVMRYDAYEYLSQPYNAPAAALLLCKLRNLKRICVISFNDDSDGMFWRAWRNISPSPTLPVLEVFRWNHYQRGGNYRPNLNHLLPVMAAAPKLKKVKVDSCHVKLDLRAEVPEELVPPKLSELLLTPGLDLSMVTSLEFLCACIPGEWFEALFSATKSLKNFTYISDTLDNSLLKFSSSQFAAALKTIVGTLERLEIDAIHYCNNSSCTPFDSFSEFPQLDTLITRYHWLARPGITGTLVDMLPPNLVTLSLGCCEGAEEDLFVDLTEVVQAKSGERYQDLERVEARFRCGEDRASLQIAELKEICKGVGVVCHVDWWGWYDTEWWDAGWDAEWTIFEEVTNTDG
jgi:hypothetical protein